MKSKLLNNKNFKIKKDVYPNAISIKFDNRRVSVINIEDHFDKEYGAYIIETKSIIHGEEHKKNVLVAKENVRGDLVISKIKISREAAEALLISLSEILNRI